MKTGRNALFFLGICLLLHACSAKAPFKLLQRKSEPQQSIVILYDNESISEKTKSDWGFACLIRTAEKTILFDTGKNSEILLYNSQILGVSLDDIDQVVISHNHPDHTGGLDVVLQRNPGIPVYLPASFPAAFIGNIVKSGAMPVLVGSPLQIADNVYLSGEMGNHTREQSLILDTPQGLVVITGCSHQGVVNVLETARKMFNKDISLIMGGFHLEGYENDQVGKIIEKFAEIGVKRCGAAHCTGTVPMKLFEKKYGENFIRMGVGRVIRF
jgi:7,8-dihydropterin-6-yl-methyl-4-(beta-D-ribofuranosyl)aminobenzene 5'-phosphate synthase